MERSYDKKYNLRLPDEVFERVEELGRKYDRSVNEQMVYMLRTWQEPSVLEDRLLRLESQVFAIPQQATG
jgi:predicted DNA-binding protein